MYSFCVGFYAIPLAEEISIQNAWITFAMIQVAFFFPMVLLMWKGEGWRKS
jgi:hypothetical protein